MKYRQVLQLTKVQQQQKKTFLIDSGNLNFIELEHPQVPVEYKQIIYAPQLLKSRIKLQFYILDFLYGSKRFISTTLKIQLQKQTYTEYVIVVSQNLPSSKIQMSGSFFSLPKRI